MVRDRISISQETRAAVILQTHLVILMKLTLMEGKHMEQLSFQKHEQLI